MSFTIPDDEVLEIDNFVPDDNETITLNLLENEDLFNELDDTEVLIAQIDSLENNDADKTQIWEKYQRKCKKPYY